MFGLGLYLKEVVGECTENHPQNQVRRINFCNNTHFSTR